MNKQLFLIFFFLFTTLPVLCTIIAHIPIITDFHESQKFDQNCNGATNGESLVIKSIITNNGFIVDAGCSTGEWTACVLRYHPDASILAFEPLPKIAEKTAWRFHHNPNVIVMPCALSNKIGSHQFTTYYENCELSSIYPRPTVAHQFKLTMQTIIVPTTTLDFVCSERAIDHIDFLKIDTEGSELDVLQGCSTLLSLGKIKVIQFEYGGTYYDANIRLKDVFSLLHLYNYKIFRICSKGLIPTDWHPTLENYLYANYLAIHIQEL